MDAIKLLESGDDYDFVIHGANDRKFYVHLNHLISAGLFGAAARHHAITGDEGFPSVSLAEYSPDAVHNLLRIIYTGEPPANMIAGRMILHNQLCWNTKFEPDEIEELARLIDYVSPSPALVDLLARIKIGDTWNIKDLGRLYMQFSYQLRDRMVKALDKDTRVFEHMTVDGILRAAKNTGAFNRKAEEYADIIGSIMARKDSVITIHNIRVFLALFPRFSEAPFAQKRLRDKVSNDDIEIDCLVAAKLGIPYTI